ncbi:protein dispatched [Chelonus insularis]|uniref:protein dispatched n=1 Tax=Chelonus insularis TaxID=460826 RepID=UPI001589DEAB|nr:protein dispatched [Chelonus insularis]
MEVWWFSRVVAHHPYAILAAVFVLSSTCLIVPLATNNFPDFSDPQMGFEARGTPLAKRFTAWYNLMRATGARGELVDDPIEYYNYLLQLMKQNSTDSFNSTRSIPGILRKKPKNKKKKNKKHNKNSNDTVSDVTDTNSEDKWNELLKLKNKNQFEHIDNHENHNHLDEDFFCHVPTSAYARVVIGSNSKEKSLWSLEGVLAQCHIDAMFRANPKFSSICEVPTGDGPRSKKCCRSWSPANYVAFLSNRTSCLGVTESDLIKIENLLKKCAYYYHHRYLTADCTEDFNCQKQVPPECYVHNAPYHLLHFLLDSNFMSREVVKNNSNTTLEFVMLFLPFAASSAASDFYCDIKDDGLVYGNFQVVGMELGLKSTLFDRMLVADTCLLLSGFLFITICIWAYTNSIILTITTILAVVFSLGISYAIYTLALKISFFPFMNFLAVIVAVGIGADDAFIFCKIWEQHKQQKNSNGSLTKVVQETMKHAVPSMFVTSLTTAVAFFASIVSNVTAINCFSLFSGMTVIANFFLMITWLPASVVVADHCNLMILSPANLIVRKIIRPFKITMNKLVAGFSDLLMRLVIGLRWLWISTLGAIVLIGGVIVFSYPGLRLPNSPDFQLFDSSHLFERYTSLYAPKFWFEKSDMGEGAGLLPLRFVWGIKPYDNGDYLDPASRGELIWDETFNITDKESQLWLEQFCRNLRTQPFYHNTLGPLISNCFIESFRSWMARRCEDVINPQISRAPCCESSTYPYTPEVLSRCVAEASADLYRTPAYLWTRGGVVAGGIKYLKDSVKLQVDENNITLPMPLPKIMALIVEYDSTYSYSLSFTEMNEFYNKVENWMQEQLKGAPPGMRGGWFVSHLEFYELQRTLYEGTLWAMGVSMILALIVLAFVTLNPLLSLYAIVTIGGAILVTVAALVLLNWRLNVLESVAVSTAIGLAVDFSLHYSVSYRACKSEKKVDKVKAALEQMGGPTLMAAVTSGASGAFMLPSHVLAYIQIAIFLILVMCVSWIYATFFLCPLLYVIGPSSDFAQFHYSKLKKYLPGLSTSRWLEAVWEPSAKISALPGGLEMIDITGDGQARLICIDIPPESTESSKIRVFKGGEQINEIPVLEPPCGVVGFYTENNELRSAVVAVGSAASVFIYKNMKPHFKYNLPCLDAHPKEREIWNKACSEGDLNIKSLCDDLELLSNELGASFMTPRTLKFLSMDENHRLEFVEQYRNVPLTKPNCLCVIGTVRKDSWHDPACSCLVLGTEIGEILILDPRSFSLTDKLYLGWAPAAIASAGLWSGDGKIFVASRDTRIGVLKKGMSAISLWENLAAPVVAIATLAAEGLAAVLMNGTLVGLSMNGAKLWEVQLVDFALDMISIPVPQTGLSLLAISIPQVGILIYDAQHHVDTISTLEPISAMKYGRMGQEERALALVTLRGGLCVKILKRTANFSSRIDNSNTSVNSSQKFSIPKKTRLFLEQTNREKAEAKNIHSTFERDFLQLQLAVAKKANELLYSQASPANNSVNMEISVLGLGPTYVIRTVLSTVKEKTLNEGLHLLYRSEETVDIDRRIIDLPFILAGHPVPVTVRATPKSLIPEKVEVLLCRFDQKKPVAVSSVMLPVPEPEIEV